LHAMAKQWQSEKKLKSGRGTTASRAVYVVYTNA
jgi:hypothetical protein